MKRLAILLTSVMLCACSGTGGGDRSDWPLFRGDASLSGYTRRSLPDDPVLLWSLSTGSRTVSSPVVLDGTVYWCDTKGTVIGVDSQGDTAFVYRFDTPVESIPMIHDSVIYLGRIDGRLAALSLSECDTLWTFPTMGQISGSPNIMKLKDRDAVVFGSYDYLMYCVDRETGELINCFESGYYLNGAVAVTETFSVYGGCDAWLRVVDCQKGTVTDSLQLDGYVPASPAIIGDHVYVGDYSGNIYEVLLDDGKIQRYRKMMEADQNNASFTSVPAVSPKRLYALSSDRNLYCLDRVSGDVLWKVLLKGNVGESSPLVCSDKVIVCSKSGIVSILDAEDGSLLWEFDTGEQIVSSPAVADGRFHILTAKGTLFCFGKE